MGTVSIKWLSHYEKSPVGDLGEVAKNYDQAMAKVGVAKDIYRAFYMFSDEPRGPMSFTIERVITDGIYAYEK